MQQNSKILRSAHSWQLCTFAMSVVINGFTKDPGHGDRLTTRPYKMPKPTREETLKSSLVQSMSAHSWQLEQFTMSAVIRAGTFRRSVPKFARAFNDSKTMT